MKKTRGGGAGVSCTVCDSYIPYKCDHPLSQTENVDLVYSILIIKATLYESRLSEGPHKRGNTVLYLAEMGCPRKNLLRFEFLKTVAVEHGKLIQRSTERT